MQKLINVLAVTSFVISSGIVIVGYNLYEHRQELIDYAEDYATGKIQELLPMPLPSGPDAMDIPSVPFGGF